VGRQLELVRRRRDALADLERELVVKQTRVTELLEDL
jgi:hypothetical protein